ncbi:MAG: hypothetical protein HYS62_01060 [Candidatus Aenigmarchaeota archaeon]|nr:hypothetical protein [Candidatus Aenigmarchaeota archaeon]
MRLDWKIYVIAAGALLLGLMILFLEKVFFFLIIALATILVAIVLRFVPPLKYLGIELVTLSTMLVGIVYGPVLGGIYAVTILLAHLIIGDYYIGAFLAWVVPLYISLGIASGILGGNLIGVLGVMVIAGINALSLFLTFIGESERVAKEMPYVIGNTLINSVLILNVLGVIVNFMI